MSDRARLFEDARRARDAAKATLDGRLGLLREDIAARSVGGRIVDGVVEEAADIALEAADIAEEHRGILAGTVGLLILWLMREPIISGVRRLVGSDDD